MSPLIQKVQTPKNCSKFENINTAFCISHMLFNKNNTCSFEPLQQSCYLHGDMNHLLEEVEGCHEGFYARCIMNDYQKHIKDNDCVLAEASLIEWCTCKETVNGTRQEEKVEKECICFPHHIRPYVIHNTKSIHKENDKENSCVCSNIYRKKCSFPKDRKVRNEKINCTTVNDILSLESNMNCSDSVHQKKVEYFKKRHSDREKNRIWSELVKQRKNFIINRKNESKNATKATLSNTMNSKNSTNTVSQFASLERRNISDKEPSQESDIIISELPKFKLIIGTNGTISPEEQNLEGALDHLLNGILGKVNFTQYKNLYHDSQLKHILFPDSSSVTHRKQKMQRTNLAHRNGNSINENSLSSDITLMSHIYGNYSNIVPKFHGTDLNYHHPHKKQISDSSAKIMYGSVFGSFFIFAIMVCIIFKQIRRQRKYSSLEEVEIENENSTEATANLLKEDSNIHKNDFQNKTKKTLNNHVLYFAKSKDDNKCLISNEELDEQLYI